MMGKCNRHMIKYPRLQFVQIMLLLHFFSFCKFGYVKNKYIDLDSSSYSYIQFRLQLKKLIINYVTKFIFIYQYIRLDTFNAKVNVKEIICGEKWCTKFRLNVCFVYQRKEQYIYARARNKYAMNQDFTKLLNSTICQKQ